jgi:hypothetical protein
MYEYEQLICNTFTCSHFSVTNVVHAALNDRVLNPTHFSQLCFEGRHHDVGLGLGRFYSLERVLDIFETLMPPCKLTLTSC